MSIGCACQTRCTRYRAWRSEYVPELLCYRTHVRRSILSVAGLGAGAVDASESKEALASDRLLSSDWDLTQLGWVSALAARFSSRREERSLRGFAQLKLNHDAITEPSSAAEEERANEEERRRRRRHLLWECSASFPFG